MPVAFSAIGIL